MTEDDRTVTGEETMTEETPEGGTREGPTPDDHRPTLGDLSHTNPYTNKSFGDAMVYRRGPTVAADGGADQQQAPVDETAVSTGSRLEDVDHTPPDGEGAHEVYRRGREGRDGSV